MKTPHFTNIRQLIYLNWLEERRTLFLFVLISAVVLFGLPEIAKNIPETYKNLLTWFVIIIGLGILVGYPILAAQNLVGIKYPRQANHFLLCKPLTMIEWLGATIISLFIHCVVPLGIIIALTFWKYPLELKITAQGVDTSALLTDIILWGQFFPTPMLIVSYVLFLSLLSVIFPKRMPMSVGFVFAIALICFCIYWQTRILVELNFMEEFSFIMPYAKYVFPFISLPILFMYLASVRRKAWLWYPLFIFCVSLLFILEIGATLRNMRDLKVEAILYDGKSISHNPSK